MNNKPIFLEVSIKLETLQCEEPEKYINIPIMHNEKPIGVITDGRVIDDEIQFKIMMFTQYVPKYLLNEEENKVENYILSFSYVVDKYGNIIPFSIRMIYNMG